jgi:hypothetical protein
VLFISLVKFLRKKKMELNFVNNVSKNNKFVWELFTASIEDVTDSTCDNFLDRIFKTAAKAGNKYKHNAKYK